MFQQLSLLNDRFKQAGNFFVILPINLIELGVNFFQLAVALLFGFRDFTVHLGNQLAF